MSPRIDTPRPRSSASSTTAVDPLAAPLAWVLGHPRHRVLVSAAGSGQSCAGEHALTRWSGDRVEDREGWFCTVRDLDDGRVTSPTLQPLRRSGETLTVAGDHGRVTFTRRDAGLELTLEVAVDPAAALELRRLTLRDLSGRGRRLEVTGVAEVVLHHAEADAAHPAFAKLFVQTEAEPALGALLARRRPRSPEERHPWLVCALVGPGTLEWETDRARFLGRGRGFATPRALTGREPLSGTVGNVLDPVVALRRTLTLAPGGEARLGWVLGSAPDRAQALALVEGWDAERMSETLARAAADAAARAHALGLDPVGARRASALAGAMLYGVPGLGAETAVLERALVDPARLASLGLDPLRPLVLALAPPLEHAGRVAELVATHRWWRSSGLAVETRVVWDAGAAGLAGSLPKEEGLAALRRDTLRAEDLDALLAHARLVVGSALPDPGRTTPTAPVGPADPPPHPRGERLPDEPLLRANGYGGFSPDGHEYVIRMPLDEDGVPRRPPSPWVNVIANERFGTLVSETGAGCTWSGNSREHRLTPWFNDPLLDPHGEAFYVRDDRTRALISPMPGPCPGAGEYVVRHGFGASGWRHVSDGLELETEVFVARRDPMRLTRVRVTNRGAVERVVSLASYQCLVLGTLPGASTAPLVTTHDPASGLLLARRGGSGDFAGTVVFAAVVPPTGASPVTHTTDREAFLGRWGSPARPAMLARGGVLDGRTGAGLDPCFAHQLSVTLAPGATVTGVFVLGAAASLDDARALVAGCREPGAVEKALAETRRGWLDTTDRIRVKTPSDAIDLMVNGWLVYQTLGCRMWARTAFYQSGGAWGFRDQLQDSAALTLTHPGVTRAQLLLHAAHQFVEGDVLHWWHPPAGRGLRTRFADDLLWLPYLTAGYVATTGDLGVLDEHVRYLTARALAPGEDEAYLEPRDAGVFGSLYEHCCRAVERSLVTGAHGLPLFGTGDWNDGMNRVGREGKGESVWMAFFLHAVIGDFLPLVDARDDRDRASRWRRHRDELRAAIERDGWDGGWYRRAYYDDGTPLGTRDGDECRIDALAQAWAVISGAAAPERAAAAMDAVERELVDERHGLIRLLTPPFEHTSHDPGYIKGYVPGVRENGGQYTHAALWVVRAVAELGRRDRAAKLLEMLTPVHHTATPERLATYQVEPYVVAADVYGAAPHVGRGGWTWYTGSSGWMMRVAMESVLGVRLHQGRTLVVRPCIPRDWSGYELVWRPSDDGTVMEITVLNGGGDGTVREARLDGAPVPVADGAARIPLARDGRTHRVEIVLG
ncbi:MAG: GH36-type glycosyl hydrolase domain-containing protein [Candidatus Eisenbacteria bacterium]